MVRRPRDLQPTRVYFRHSVSVFAISPRKKKHVGNAATDLFLQITNNNPFDLRLTSSNIHEKPGKFRVITQIRKGKFSGTQDPWISWRICLSLQCRTTLRLFKFLRCSSESGCTPQGRRCVRGVWAVSLCFSVAEVKRLIRIFPRKKSSESLIIVSAPFPRMSSIASINFSKIRAHLAVSALNMRDSAVRTSLHFAENWQTFPWKDKADWIQKYRTPIGDPRRNVIFKMCCFRWLFERVKRSLASLTACVGVEEAYVKAR